jgi:hypothetical protein
LSSSDPSKREHALAEVVRVGGDDAFRCISRAFDDEADNVRNAAARALYELEPDVLPPLQGHRAKVRLNGGEKSEMLWPGLVLRAMQLRTLPVRVVKEHMTRFRCFS